MEEVVEEDVVVHLFSSPDSSAGKEECIHNKRGG